MKEPAGNVAIGLVMVAIATGIILVILVTAAHSHSIKLRDGSVFQFPWLCCTGDDCVEIPLRSIKQEGNGWVVDAVNPKTGHQMQDFIIENDKYKHHWAPDERVFACESPFLNPNKTNSVRCLFTPKPAT